MKPTDALRVLADELDKMGVNLEDFVSENGPKIKTKIKTKLETTNNEINTKELFDEIDDIITERIEIIEDYLIDNMSYMIAENMSEIKADVYNHIVDLLDRRINNN